MSTDVTLQTIDRGILSAHSEQALEEGADYLKGHPIKDWILWIITAGIYTKLARSEINTKKQTLRNDSPDLTETIINAPKTGNDYSCTVRINNPTVVNHGPVTVPTQFDISYDAASRTISIVDQNNPTNVISHPDFSFNKLRKELLEQYLRARRAQGNLAIDLSIFDLSGIDLKEVDLSQAVLNRENLEAVIKSNGNLSGATLAEDIDIANLAFKDVKMDREMLATLILLKADLKGVDLSNRQDLEDMTLEELDLTGANFANTNLKLVKFNGTKLVDANFTSANLAGASFIGADLTNITTSDKTDFNESDMRLATIEDMLGNIAPDQRKTIILDVDQVLNAHQKDISLQHANLSGAPGAPTNSFLNQDLSRLDLSDTYLAGTNFNGTDLTDAKLVNADLSNVTMDAHTNLTNTDLTNANFYFVNLRSVVIKDSTIISNIQVMGTRLSREWVEAAIRQGVTSLKGANLDNIDLSNLDLSGIDLTNVDLKGATLFGTKLNASGLTAAINSREVKADNGQRISVDLKGIDLSGTAENPHQLHGINFNYADLTGANFDHCFLADSTFDESNLTRVDLRTTSLKNIVIGAGKKIIVSDEDRRPWVEQLQNRLRFIIRGNKIGADPFYLIPPDHRLSLYKSMFFPVTKLTLDYGDTNSDQGPQKIVIESQLDERHINPLLNNKDERKKVIKSAEQKLLGDEFSKEQKILFHWARATMWKAIASFNAVAARHDSAMSENRVSEGDILMEATFKSEVYLRNDEFGRALSQQALDVCFSTALHEFQKTGYRSGSAQIGYVYELFTSKNYAW